MKLKFTFTSLGYFLILLSVVVLFVLYFRMGSGSDSDPVEGFISTQRKAEGESILLPQYSSSASITKLYDSM
jgi:hypothetical protein